MQLSIVIPCLNEEKTLPVVIGKAYRALERLGLDGEVLVSNNGSTDNSAQVAMACGARVVHCPYKGYGNTLIYGMRAARGQWLLFADADDSYNFEEIDDFVRYLEEGYDVVMGTRLKGKIEPGAMPLLHRYLGTPVLTRVLNRFFAIHISDCNCGMRAMTKQAFEEMKLHSEGMEFASEMLIKAGILKQSIKEVPITLYKDKRGRPPHLRTWSDGWRHLRFMMLYAPKHTFIWPGLAFLLAGLLPLIALAAGPVTVRSFKFDYHWSLLGGLMATIGFQAINMGLFAKIYSYAHNYIRSDDFLEAFKRRFTLERGLLAGAGLFGAGLLVNVGVLVKWLLTGFGALHSAGWVSLASALMVIGMQTIFSSFFVSTMYMHKQVANRAARIAGRKAAAARPTEAVEEPEEELVAQP